MNAFKIVIFLMLTLAMLAVNVSAGDNFTLDILQLYSEQAQTAEISISNYSELCSFRDAVNNGEYKGVNAKLTADITLSGEWTPIGNAANSFNGNFDGQGHTVSGLSITQPSAYVGLFGKISNGSVSNVKLENPVIDINTSNDTENLYSGFLAGGVICNGSENGVTLNNIKVSGGRASIVVTNYSAYCAGIAGYCESDDFGVVYVRNCNVENADLDVACAEISSFAGLVTGAFYSRSATDSAIINCVVSGNCSATANLSVAGGLVTGAGFSNGYWTSASASLAQEEKFIIIDGCIASGNVETTSGVHCNAGSISGSLSGDAALNNSYYTEDVTVTAKKGTKPIAVKFGGTKVSIAQLCDEAFIKNTVKLDTADTWKVNKDGLPTLYAFDEGCIALDVTAGTKIYYADGSYRKFDTDKTAYINLSNDGFVYVLNNDDQKVWRVADGIAHEMSALENALSIEKSAQIRTREPSGIRFSSSITDKAKYEESTVLVSEYGYIVTAETSVTGLVGGDYELDFSLVESNKAKLGVAYSIEDNKDLVFEKDFINEKTIFTGVLYNIPMTKNGVTTVVAARPYYKTSQGQVIYGEIYRTTLYDTALAIKSKNGEGYIQNKDYIDSILALVTE